MLKLIWRPFPGWEKIPNSLRANFSATAKHDLSKFPSDWPEIEYLLVGGFFGYQQNFVRDAPGDGYNYATVATALITPLSRGTISISSANTADPPIIDPNWLTHPTDVELAIAAFKRSRQLFQTKAMKPILIGPEYFPGPSVQTDAQILAWIRKAFNTVFHASSTCAMGVATDPKAVVDSKARVFGVSKLRVVDASAFPFLVPGHPMSTICKCLLSRLGRLHLLCDETAFLEWIE
jgi:choline dehydrogenase